MTDLIEVGYYMFPESNYPYYRPNALAYACSTLLDKLERVFGS